MGRSPKKNKDPRYKGLDGRSSLTQFQLSLQPPPGVKKASSDKSDNGTINSQISEKQNNIDNGNGNDVNDNDDNPYKDLERLIDKHCQDQKPFVFLHPFDYGENSVSPGSRNYTEKELEALSQRDFETRLFITNATFTGDSVWLRTHFSDNHIHETKFNKIRDYIKAMYATKNYTAAKAVLAELLTMCMEMDKSSYHSFAITVASGLSNMGANTTFEHSSGNSPDSTRRGLCLLMHFIFDKMSTSDFLKNDGSNIYRLVHCSTSISRRNKYELSIPLFSFLLQICLTVFVLLENYTAFQNFSDGEKPHGDNDIHLSAVLASLTFGYSALVAYPGVRELKDAYKVYGRTGPIHMMDFVVNTILPFVLLFSGFLVILLSDSYIDSVLNTAALLFIPEIDDQLPSLLGYSETVIFNNFLTNESMGDFDQWCHCGRPQLTETVLRSINDSIGVQFSDYYLTNWPEQGPNSEEGIHFQPYQVKVGETMNGDVKGHEISPTGFVTEECLITKIIWSYTTGFESTIKPRIGYLRLEMINGQVVEINMKGDAHDAQRYSAGDIYHELEGVFIITTFQMSNSILRLRVCGSYNALDFETAFDYYSLWPITRHARQCLARHQKLQNEFKAIQHFKSFRSVNGYESVTNNDYDKNNF